MSKKNKGTTFWSKNLFFVFLIPILFCLFAFYGAKNTKAGEPPLPPPPYTWINISVCTDMDSSNNVIFRSPFEPTIRWTPGGDPQDSYWLIVDNDWDMSSPSVDRSGGGVAEDTLTFGNIDLDQSKYYYILAIHGGRGWTPWTHGAFDIPYTNGTCANGLEFCAGTVITPSPSLCTDGYPVVNNGGNSSSGIWSWSCNGIGGGSDMPCSAATKKPVTGCASVDPPCTNIDTLSTSGLCKSTSQLLAGPLRTGDVWNWTCKDTACGTPMACDPLEVLPEVVPSCGSDDGKAFCTIGEEPKNLCDKGDASSLGGGAGLYEDWKWSCIGSCPTVSVGCSARGRGACGWKETN